MSRETVTRYRVAGEELEDLEAAKARRSELRQAQRKDYKALVRKAREEHQAEVARARDLLGDEAVEDELTPFVRPTAPPPVEIEEVELAVAFEIHALEPEIAAGEQIGENRIVQMGMTLDRQAAEDELARLKAGDTGEENGWRGPRHSFELVERPVPAEVADRLEADHQAALELEEAAR